MLFGEQNSQTTNERTNQEDGRTRKAQGTPRHIGSARGALSFPQRSGRVDEMGQELRDTLCRVLNRLDDMAERIDSLEETVQGAAQHAGKPQTALLTVAQVAGELGISRSHAYPTLIYSGVLPSVRLPGLTHNPRNIRVRRTDLQRFLQGLPVQYGDAVEGRL